MRCEALESSWSVASPQCVVPSHFAFPVATGNAKWDGTTHWGDATLQLDSSASHLIGNYTPTNTQYLNVTDADIGSTSPVLLGDGYVAQGGKDGKIRLLTLKLLQGFEPHSGGEWQSVSTPSGADLFTAPAVLHTGNATWMFVTDGRGTEAWTLHDGRLQSMWHNDTGGTSPVVAGGLLYVYNPRGGLHVYQPETGQQVATLECGSGHWNSPIVVDGKIALPEESANRHGESGVIDIWRVP